MKKIVFTLLIFGFQYNIYAQCGSPTCDQVIVKTPNNSDVKDCYSGCWNDDDIAYFDYDINNNPHMENLKVFYGINTDHSAITTFDQENFDKAQSLLEKAIDVRQTPIFEIRLFDWFGNLQRFVTTNKVGIVQLDVSSLPNGNYFLHIYNGVSKAPMMEQIIVKH